jgi:hypothetical protein
LLDRLGFWVQMQLMLNRLPRDSQHVNRLPCKDVPIFLEEFDEREFLFGIWTVAYMSHLRRSVAECVLWLHGCLGLEHDQV